MDSNAQRRLGFFYVFIAAGLWSSAEVVIRIVVDDISPIQLGAVRFALGGVFLGLFLPGELRRRGLRLNRRVLFHAAWMSFVGMTLANICYQYSLQHAGAGVIATLFGANPLMVLVLSALILREPLTAPRFIGVMLGFVGILILGGSEESEIFSMLGFSLGLVFVFGFSFFTVCVKRFAGEFAGLPIVALCALFSAAYFVPISLWEGDHSYFGRLPDIWLPLLYLGVGTTGMSFYFFFKGLQHVDATQATSIILLKPPLATVLAAAVLGEPVTWNLAISILLVLGGLYFVIVVYRFRTPRIFRKRGQHA